MKIACGVVRPICDNQGKCRQPSTEWVNHHPGAKIEGFLSIICVASLGVPNTNENANTRHIFSRLSDYDAAGFFAGLSARRNHFRHNIT
jgi:hypothetical protein